MASYHRSASLSVLLQSVLVLLLASACSERGATTEVDAGPLVDGTVDARPEPGPMCSNGIRDGLETTVDCGGAECDPCEYGSRCIEGTDCMGGVCSRGFCLMPTCTDGVQNGTESAVDCGGDCGLCPAGQPCTSNSECLSRRCGGGAVCLEATCTDGVLNQDESDTDCGGTCPACDAGAICRVDEDCESGRCIDGLCAEPACNDRVRNQDETAIDCGGITCDPCRDGLACVVGSDCESSTCTDNVCVP